MKKEWKKPVMTVVAKSTAEENVLWACKYAGGDIGNDGGPMDGFCGYNPSTGLYCHPGMTS